MPNPKHGYAHDARGEFALTQGWLGEWNILQFEGGKFFPTREIAGLEKEKYPDDWDKFNPDTDRPVPTGDLICSGGWTNEHGSDWDIVNNTDEELESKKNKKWPRKNVTSGQEFKINWTYSAPHETRGYNYWITKDGWDPTKRITIDQLEPAPFYMHHYPTPLPEGAAPTETSVRLPQKSGHHVMIVAWIISNTYHAFYQTFDLNFDGTTEPGPSTSISPSRNEVEKGENASFTTSTEGDAPFTYLWNLPTGLRTDDNRLDKENITYITSDITGDKTFDITCTVTDKNGKSTQARASLAVKDSSAPSIPTLQIMPNPQNVKVGSAAKFNATVKGGEGPFTYSWSLPEPLTSPDIDHNMSHITYATDNVSNSTNFDITCRVSDRNGQTADATARLLVEKDTSPDPGQCTDPDADNYPAWSSSSNYPGERTHKVSYKGLVWENKHYINAGEKAPDIHDGWILVSNIATPWNNIRSYGANSYVNHNGSQWKASYYAEPGNEPGSSTGVMWRNMGSEACEPKS